MKKIRRKSSIHIVIFAFIIVNIVMILGIILYLITVPKVNGRFAFSNWPVKYTNEFKKYFYIENGEIKLGQSGKDSLQKEHLWMQVIDSNGNEIENFNKPANIPEHYSINDILKVEEKNEGEFTLCLNEIEEKGGVWTYMIGFPNNVSRISMYINMDRFTSGKQFVIGLFIGILFIGIIFSFLWNVWMSKHLQFIIYNIKKIETRTYEPVYKDTLFRDILESLNKLNSQIEEANVLRSKNERLQEEWITNITHDLKTPLSPIKGYVELLQEAETIPVERIKRYSLVIAKNVEYAENLINDLKLTYQLKSNMLPLDKKRQNIVRIIKESIIDVLNRPEYENRSIQFYSNHDSIFCNVDALYLKRAFDNLLLNSLIHNSTNTSLAVSIQLCDNVQICISDNGRGMDAEHLDRIFNRYYRGTNTETKTEGTGLGMAIVKEIIESQKGTIEVKSEVDKGTEFLIEFPEN